MNNKIPTKKCECLTDCGDDPNLYEFKVKPCTQFIRFNLQREDLVKMCPEQEIIPFLEVEAIEKLRAAEKAWHKLFSMLPVGDQRTHAAAVFETIRTTNRKQS